MQQSGKNLLSHKCGMILVLALIWLVVFSALALVGLQTSIMQAKMSANYQAKIQAFNLAEAALVEAYSALDGIRTNGKGGRNNSFYTFELLEDHDCNSCAYYQIQATGTYNKAKTVLNVIYFVTSKEQPDGTIHKEGKLNNWKETT